MVQFIDFSGRAGSHGKNGRSYGEDAGPAESGYNGGFAKLRITRVGIYSSSIRISGVVKVHWLANENYSKEFDLGSADKISFNVSGGTGGDGGNGANGRDGTAGSAGSNATQYSRGTDGGSGGDGGDGGNGTSGGNGGNGGAVEITVHEDDMDLLYLIDRIIGNGGSGGRAGSNGKGGRGGPGGPGGSGCNWTTSQTRWVHGGSTHRNVPGTDKWEMV